MIHFDESLEIVDNLEINNYKTKELSLVDTLGYILAEDIMAGHNSPELPTSAMDGYAFMHKDISLDRLKIASVNPAGSDAKETVADGECIKTFTGSLMPEGSDTLIPIENVEVDGNHIIIHKEVDLGFSVRETGENYAKGQLLMPIGEVLDFSQIGVLASLNIPTVLVYKKPIVSIISTGSELLDVGEERTNDSQIRSSNNYTIETIVNKYGGEPLQLGCIKDDKETIMHAMADAMDRSDIVVTTGGVSVGDFDFVKDVVFELDCEVLFKGVRVKPGQHIILARKDDKFIVALPGFAYSSTIMALVYVVPLIQKLQRGTLKPPIVKAKLREPFIKRAKKAEFTACNVSIDEGRYFVDFKDKKVGTSAIMTNMLGSMALLVTSEDDSSKELGEEVDIVLV
ncbi:MAG TPA: molybdopterin molybdenumtransferase MoeA [Sulfurovum sp.]|nr:molybdopterin molybdenumtransferase MoeA [Sulfurovum sp.]